MEVIINGIVYVPKETKSELELLKEKYESGSYICIGNRVGSIDKISELDWPKWHADWQYVLIHKKHRSILDAWLADNSVEIECKSDNETYWTDNNFIKDYRENLEYRLKQQYPIFKRSEDGEVFRFDSLNKGEYILTNNWKYAEYETTMIDCDVCDWETIPYDKERGLYHLQPVFHKPNDIDCGIDFYDAEHNQLLRRGGIFKFDKIEPITSEQLKVMPFVWDMYKLLEKKSLCRPIPYKQVLKDKQ